MAIQDGPQTSLVSGDLAEILERAALLAPDDQLYLAARLLQRARLAYRSTKARRQWCEIRGKAPYPLLGEDAQAWVSRTRQEDTDHRPQQRKP